MTDIDFVRAVVTDPEVWPHLAEDIYSPDDYQPDPEAVYFRHLDHGMMEFRIASPHWCQVHIAMRRHSSGVKKFVAECMAEMRSRGYKRFTAFIPETNRSALILAYRCGYRHEGRMRGVFLKNGQYIDLIVMGAE
ncbi:hypothetical protein D3C78_638750 [compost metagenome]